MSPAFAAALALAADPSDDAAGRAARIVSGNQNGLTGAVHTATAEVVGAGHGRIGILENFDDDALDRFSFVFGPVEPLEVGVHSDLPTHEDARINLIFKLNGLPQDRFFRGQPAMSFGLDRRAAFANATWRVSPVTLTGGYSFSDEHTGPFANAGVELFGVALAQVEYDHPDREIGVALRATWAGVQLALLWSSPVGGLDTFEPSRTYVSAAYAF